MDRTVKVTVWDWDRFGRNDFIGAFSIPLRGLLPPNKPTEGWFKLFDKVCPPPRTARSPKREADANPTLTQEEGDKKFHIQELRRTTNLSVALQDYKPGLLFVYSSGFCGHVFLPLCVNWVDGVLGLQAKENFFCESLIF